MEDGHGPRIQFKTPTFRPEDAAADIEANAPSSPGKKYPALPVPSGPSHLRQRNPQLREPSPQRSTLGQDIYLGSYAHTGATTTPRGSIARITPAPSPRTSTSHVQLEHLLPYAADSDLDTYGVDEHRDGFFDAAFHRPLRRRRGDPESMRQASATLPASFQPKNSPLSLRRFVPQQWREAGGVVRQISTSRAGVTLCKTFLGCISRMWFVWSPRRGRGWGGIATSRWFLRLSIMRGGLSGRRWMGRWGRWSGRRQGWGGGRWRCMCLRRRRGRGVGTGGCWLRFWCCSRPRSAGCGVCFCGSIRLCFVRGLRFATFVSPTLLRWWGGGRCLSMGSLGFWARRSV